MHDAILQLWDQRETTCSIMPTAANCTLIILFSTVSAFKVHIIAGLINDARATYIVIYPNLGLFILWRK